MNSLILSMVWSRRTQAATLALLALFAVAAAVAAPAFLATAEQAVAAGQVATASPDELGLSINALEDRRAGGEDADTPTFSDIGPVLADLPGFDYVYSAEFPTTGIEPTHAVRTRFVYRQKACDHLVMASGRCLIAEGEVVLGEQTARRLHLVAGDSVTLTDAKYSDDPAHPGFLPDGTPKKLTIVGTYTVPDRNDQFWGTHGYFAADTGDRPGEPVFTDRSTLDAMDYGIVEQAVDGASRASALAPANLGRLRTGLDTVTQLAGELGPSITVDTRLPPLLDRIDAGRSAARLIVPLLATPLVLLACLSIFLAVGYGTEGRRPELAVVALRGTRLGGRWWLATGESVIAILIGSVAGCLAGQLLVNAVAALRFPGAGTTGGLASLRYAPLAAAAAVLAALLAQSPQLVTTIADLLRRAPAVPHSARALAGEAGFALLAIITCAQLFVSHGSLTGLGLVAPGLVVLALALLAARALLPVVTRWAGQALSRGWLGAALAGFQLSRRPGAARLFALLVAGVAVAGYATCAVDVAAQGRVVESELGTGASRVISVLDVPRQQLLDAERAVDPAGAFAMAVTELPGTGPDGAGGLAVDSTRLAAVANWPGDGPSAAAVAHALHPAAPAPVLLGGQDLTLDLSGGGWDTAKPPLLSVVVSGVTGLGDDVVQLGVLHEGRFTYRQRVSVCRLGCRLNALGITAQGSSGGLTAQITVRGIGTAGPARSAVPAAQLADPARWRLTQGGGVAAAPDGLHITIDAPNGLPDGTYLQPVDTPYPLPVASAGTVLLSDRITGLDGRTIPADRSMRLPLVPGAGTHATLADLEYAGRLSTHAGPAVHPQIWLNDKAPADILDRLTGQGLVITGDVRADQIRRQLDTQGPALALWFYILAGCLATALCAGALVLAATVDRARRVEDLSALRAQGFGRPALRQATLWTYPLLVTIAVIAGLAITLITWALTGWALPLAGIDPPDLPLPAWPRPPVLLIVLAAVLAVLSGVAYLTGRRTLKDIR